MRRAHPAKGINSLHSEDCRHLHAFSLPSQQTPLRSRLFLYGSLLKECTKTQNLAQGRILHDHLTRNGVGETLALSNFLVDMYASCGCMQEAPHVFFSMQVEGVLADEFTYSSILGGFSDQKSLSYGRYIHACILANGFHDGAVVLTALVNMYGKCGSVERARVAFDAIRVKDAMSWNSMIAACAHQGQPKEALHLYGQMKQNNLTPTDNTFISVLRACSNKKALIYGKHIHADIIDGGFQSDLVRTALVSMYGNCGCLNEAETVFREIRKHDVISLNAMLGVYVLYDHGKDAIEIYLQMWKMGFEPTRPTLVHVLSACALLGAAVKGKNIYMLVLENSLESDDMLATATVSMYGKCGHLDDAWAVFNRLNVRDDVAWNAIIGSYAQNGDDKMALQLFQQMQQDGIKPDSATYVSVLCACSHSGSLQDAEEYFDSMKRDYSIEPNTKHYACIIDLFGRAGLVEEAEIFLKKMPIEPDTVVLTAFSGACRVHGDFLRGKWAAERIMDLDPQIEAPYITLSNIYASEGRWEDVARVRARMEQNVQNHAGRSWIEADNIVHEFASQDRSHPQTREIYAKLFDLSEELKRKGYVQGKKVMWQDIDEKPMEGLLCHHCEMLAIAFGFISIPNRATIRVSKNLSMCPDCHAATKVLSKIGKREIIVRDAYCFHHFVEGSCSCGDYW